MQSSQMQPSEPFALLFTTRMFLEQNEQLEVPSDLKFSALIKEVQFATHSSQMFSPGPRIIVSTSD